MNRNLHVYRNLGVAVARRTCGRCRSETCHSIYFETDANQRKLCSIGCNECGSGTSISEALYDELYELSFAFDQLQDGTLSPDAFDRKIPDASRRFLASLAEEGVGDLNEDKSKGPVAAGVGSKSGPASWPKPKQLDSRPPELVLRNGLGDTLGTGIFMAVLTGLVGLAFSLFFEFPAWMMGGSTVAVVACQAGGGFLVGTWLSRKRFPRRVKISQSGLLIEPRGKGDARRYPFNAVSRVNFGEGSKYLTVWLGDGNTFVVRADKAALPALDRYFGK
ncbi:hypothetical protein IEN85_10360 [Pelagicoccus sp. NFK12]|uniref:Uncharacterized protein n=1 Tax=Pelagicoccus enzymogenes TaxID=2773457 RepID=A0A927F8K5_9BACT|nr:hypothetical protein [Pelagicoccus enzymogenes]MBD5779890.1 hypothetical protein [Pelagicoccus enzymogenes]